MTLTLYHFGNSVCSEKARLALNEKGVRDWRSEELDLFAGDQFKPDYLKLNPKAQVPTLVDGDRVIVESTLICDYIDDCFPDPPLKPADPYGRARMRLYTKAVDEGAHHAVGALSFASMFSDRHRKMSPEARAAHFARIPDYERRERQGAIFAAGADAPHVYKGVVALEKLFQRTERALADSRTWLMGDQFTLAEISIAPYLARLEHVDLLDVWLASKPLTAAWSQRIKGRRSFDEEVVRWIRPGEWAEMQQGGRRIKEKVAGYRHHYLTTDPGAPYF